MSTPMTDTTCVYLLWGPGNGNDPRRLIGIFDSPDKAKEAAQEHSGVEGRRLDWITIDRGDVYYANHPAPFDYRIVRWPLNEYQSF